MAQLCARAAVAFITVTKVVTAVTIHLQTGFRNPKFETRNSPVNGESVLSFESRIANFEFPVSSFQFPVSICLPSALPYAHGQQPDAIREHNKHHAKHEN